MTALSRLISRALYMFVAKRLPPTNVPWAFASGRLRTTLVRHFSVRDIHPSANIEHGAAIVSNDISIGPNSGIGINSWIQGPVSIGADVMMGPECRIYTRNHAHADLARPMRLQGFEAPRAVTIDDDVWLGARVMIMPGTTVGRGSILAAGTIVTRDVPPYSVVAGVPARIVRDRSRSTDEKGI